LPEYVVGLSVIGISFVSEILPRLHLGLVCREGCYPSHLSIPRMQRRFDFVRKPCRLLSLLEKHFSLLVSTTSYFFAIIATPSRFLPNTLAADEATAATPSPMRIPEPLKTRTIRCLQRLFLRLCPPGPLTLCGRTSYTCAFV